MINTNSNTIRFDAYLYNEMSKEERDQFEKELNHNSNLALEFSEHKKFLADFIEGVDYRETSKKLKSIHKSIYNPEVNFFTSRKFYIPLAVAASFIFILLAVNPFIHEGSSATSSGHDDKLAYEESTDTTILYEDSYATAVAEMVDTIYEDQSKTASDQFLTILTTSPSGTAFMISRDGYFLTAKHLVEGKKIVRLQQKDEDLTFETTVVYIDPTEDFAILKCNQKVAQNFKGIPFRFIDKEPLSKQEIFTLGYPKNELIYTEGVISSKNGYISDSLTFESTFPSSPGYSGAPLFTYDGDLVGLIGSTNNRKKSVTYVLDHHYIQHILDSLKENDIEFVNMSQNYNIRPKNHEDLVKWYKPYIFEVHP